MIAVLRIRFDTNKNPVSVWSHQFHLAKEHERTHQSRYANGDVPTRFRPSGHTLGPSSDRSCYRRAVL